MVMTTVYNGKLNAPTGDDELDRLMDEIRSRTGRNWQVGRYIYTIEKKLFQPDVTHYMYQLLLEVGGVLPYQIINCATGNINTVKAYLYGYLSGLDEVVL